VRRLISIAAVLALLGAACTPSTTADAISLAEELTESATEVNAAVGEFFDVLAMAFENRTQLATRIVDLRLPTRIAIELDKASRVNPSPGAEPELDRYLAFLGELLLASEDLDAAVATEDPVGIALAAVSFEVSSGALAVALPPSSCEVLVPVLTRDLCSRSGRDGYERALDSEIRFFVASFRPAFRLPGTFGDVVRARALGSLQSDATLVLQNTAVRIGALEPTPSYLRLQQMLIDYFPAAAEVWSRFEANPDGADPLLYQFITSSLEDVRHATRQQLELEYDIVLAADATSQIVEILGIWFDPPPTTDE